MRPVPLTTLKGGINRLKVKGDVSAQRLYDLVNAYITQEGTIVPREGTVRTATLTSATAGLMAMDGTFNVFSNTLQTVPANYICNLLVHPTDPAATIVTIWFSKPFLGFPYVVAEFSNGDVLHFWLQSNGTWKANTVYKTSEIITPFALPNGLAYEATRAMPLSPGWAPQTTTAAGDVVEPTTYTGFVYRAVDVSGSAPHTGSVEPVWPTTIGGIIQEFGDFSTSSTDSGTTQDTSDTGTGAQPLGSNITDRYGNSSTIAGQTGLPTASSAPSVAAAQDVTVWAPGTLYPRGSVVQPSTTQGAFIGAIPNGDFEAGNDGNWVLTAGVTYQSAGQYQGNFGLRLIANNNVQRATMFNFGTVSPGQSVTTTAYLNPNNSGADLSMGLTLRWYDAADSFISETPDIATPALWQQGGGYRLVTTTGVAPANAAHVRVSVFARNGTSSKTGFADLITWNLETPAAISNFLFEAIQTNPASSASTEPTWPTVAGNTVVDGGVTWIAIGTSIITWQAIPIMLSGASEPSWPTTIGNTVNDPSTYTSEDSHVTDTSLSWTTINRQVPAPNPGKVVALGASHIFNGDNDIVDFSAAVNPTDWTTKDNAGYLPTGLNNYGDNPVAAMALYRSNLTVFNAGGFQMWQIDPDPANMALLDAQPVGSVYTRTWQSVANDLVGVTEVGVRNVSTVGASANMQLGNTGQPVDPLVKAQLVAATYDPMSLYYPGRGQYWAIFGPQAFVLTINGNSQKTWSRYIFPDSITDWTLNGPSLYMRTAGDLVWRLDASASAFGDDMHGEITPPVLAGVMVGSDLHLSWTASVSEDSVVTGYRLYNVLTNVLMADQPGLNFVIPSFNTSLLQSFEVFGYDASFNQSVFSNAITYGGIEAPVLTYVSGDRSAQLLTCTVPASVNPVAGYRLYNAATNVLIVDQATPTFNLGAMVASTQESFYVKAYDTMSNVSNASNTVRAKLVLVNLNSITNAAASSTGAAAVGVIVNGLNPADNILMRPNLAVSATFIAWSPWGVPSPVGFHQGSVYKFEVIKDGVPASNVEFVNAGGATLNGYVAARAAFISTFPSGVNLTGASAYTFWIFDTPITDNTGGISLEVLITRQT